MSMIGTESRTVVTKVLKSEARFSGIILSATEVTIPGRSSFVTLDNYDNARGAFMGVESARTAAAFFTDLADALEQFKESK